MPGELLATAQAAKHLGIDRRTLAIHARRGLLRPTLTLPTGYHRWSLEDIQRQLREIRQRGETNRRPSASLPTAR